MRASLEVLRGSVRPLVTVAVMAVFCYCFLSGRVPSDAFVTVAATVVAFWFSSRQSQSR